MKESLHAIAWKGSPGLFYRRTLKWLMAIVVVTGISVLPAHAALNGNYTIDAAGTATATNYKTFASAVSDLLSGTRADGGPANGAGVTGPVTFNVAKGTYIEALTISTITGASFTNRVTFQSASGVAADVWLGDNTANVAIVTMKNASYITFKNMTVRKQTRSTASSRPFELQATGTTAATKCRNIQIIGCIMETQWSGSTAANYCIMSTGDNDSLKLKRNTASNTCGLLYHVGDKTTYTKGIEIDSNILNSAVSALWWAIGSISNVDAIKIRYNDVSNNNFSGGGTGGPGVLDITNVSNQMVIAYNRSMQSDATWAYNIRNINVLGETTPALIYNNFVHHQGPNAQAPLYLSNSNYVNIYHNNVYAIGASSSALRVDGADTRVKVRIANNHFYAASAPAINLVGSLVTFDYVNGNNYWNNSGGDIASYGGINYASLVPMRGKIHTTPWANDRNSFNMNPLYTLSSLYDLRVGVNCVNGEFLGITDDFFQLPNSGAIGAHQPTQVLNDIGIEAVVYPTFPMSSGTQDVMVRIRNFGSNNVTSATIGYILNGATPVTQTLPSTLGSCDSISIVFTGVTFLAGKNNFKVYTATPNGGADTKIANDTLVYPVCTPLNGTYTINAASATSGTNFQNFTDAVAQLNCGGVSGPVTFNVAAATYTEQIALGKINGASPTNNIQFIGADSTTTILTSAASPTRTTLLFKGAKHVHFRKLSIRATSASQGIAVGFAPGSDSNSVKNCLINVTGLTSQNFAGIMFSQTGLAAGNGSNCNDNVIDNNIINGGYWGIYIYGNSGATVASAPKRNKFTRNVINSYFYGVDGQYADFTDITSNKITVTAGTANGIRMYYSPSTNLVYSNNVTSPYKGIVLAYTYASGSARSKVVNNMVWVSANNAAANALEVANYNLDVWSNTFVHTGPQGSSVRFIYFATGSLGYTFQNNLIYATSGAYALEMNMYNNANPGFSSWDWDNIYSGTANYCYYRNANGSVITYYNTLADLKAAYSPSGFVANTISKPVTFAGPTGDYHLATYIDAPRGLPISGITTDVDGDPRCPTNPTIGADECRFTDPLFSAGFVAPDTAYVDAPFNMLNKFSADKPIRHQWDIHNDGSVESTTSNFWVTFTTPGIDSVRLTSTSCIGSGSVVRYFVVLPASQKPRAEFIADRYDVLNGETINLTNLSRDGATSFQWILTPGGGAGTFDPSDTSFNAKLTFNAAGRYQLCLVASNSFGSDTLCKGTYFNVKEEAAMCYSAPSRSAEGILRDEGGTGNYTKVNNSTKKRCTMLIDPCASSLTFKFNSFSLNTTNSGGTNGQDSVRIFNGDNYNAPVIGAWSSNNPPAIGSIYTASSGKIMVEAMIMNNQAGGVGAGYEIEWKSTPKLFAAPNVILSSLDTAYVDADYVLRLKSDRNDLVYDVDMDGDLSTIDYEDYTDSVFYWNYSDPGPVEITVIAKGCGGPVQYKKTIIVDYADEAPRVDFTSDKTDIYPNDVVRFTDLTGEGPVGWEWDIYPLNYTYEEGTSNTSQDPVVKFYAPGCYTVKLWAQNYNAFPDDTASIVKTCYINVISYCEPAVGVTNSDIGISRVRLGVLDNASANGVTPYTYYSSVAVPTLNLGYQYNVTLDRTTTLNRMNRKVWIDYDGNGQFDPIAELVAFEASATTASYTGTFKVPLTAKLGTTRMRVGTSFGSDANNPCGVNAFGEFEDYNVTIGSIPDMVKPFIIMYGSDTTIEVGSAYTDAGADAEDVFDGNLTPLMVTTNNVDPAVLGTYTVVYTVSDAAGNKADTVIRYVTVVDTQIPVITLNGSDPDSVVVYGSWSDPGATATDNYYTGLAVNATTLRTDSVGIFDVEYTSADGSGNNAVKVTRKVKVYDNVAPVITRTGKDTVIVDVNTSYTDAGATVADNYYKGLTVTTTGTLNLNLLGHYTLSYDVTDPSGNVAGTVTRVVKVVDRMAPSMSLNGPSFLNVQWAAPYTDAGVTATDNYYSQSDMIPSAGYKVTNGVDVNTPGGPYYVTYELTDPSGNKAASVTRTVYVIAYAGVEEQVTNDINLFPNPSNGTVKVQILKSDDVQITVYNSLGQQIDVRPSRESDHMYSFDLSGFAAGAYLVRVQQGDMVVNKTVNLVR